VWHGDTLHLDAALGDSIELTRPLLRTRVSGQPADEQAARALGEQAALALREAGAGAYLPAN
jgi:hypothetical protein